MTDSFLIHHFLSKKLKIPFYHNLKLKHLKKNTYRCTISCLYTRTNWTRNCWASTPWSTCGTTRYAIWSIRCPCQLTSSQKPKEKCKLTRIKWRRWKVAVLKRSAAGWLSVLQVRNFACLSITFIEKILTWNMYTSLGY